MDKPRLFIELKQEQHLELLKRMYQIRFFEEAAGRYYRKGMVKGGIHASIGQEAVAVGICAHLRTNDLITSTHRGHGHHIAKGADLNKLMAEILGKEEGYCKGRGGSMHVAAFDIGSLGAFPVVAAGVPSAVGAGLSIRLQKDDRIAVSFFGDGALGQGTIYECMNLAAIWKLPVVFVCENNRFAVSTDCSTSIAIEDFAKMAESHGLKAYQVDGQDLEKVHDTMFRAVDYLKAEEQPVFIQADTFRFEGHYFGEPEVNRDKDQIRQMRESQDPIERFVFWLQDRYEDDIIERIDRVKQDAFDDIESACGFAENGSDPAPETYAEYIYA